MMKKSPATNPRNNMPASHSLKKDNSVRVNEQKSGRTPGRPTRSRRNRNQKGSACNSLVGAHVVSEKNGQKLPPVVNDNSKTSDKKEKASSRKDKSAKRSNKSAEISNRVEPEVVRNRRRTRNQKDPKICSDRSNVKKTLWAYYNKRNPSKETDKLDFLTFFLLDLLITPAKEREAVIAMEASSRGILLQEHNSWMLNPAFVNWQKQPFRRVYEEMRRVYSRRSLAGKNLITCSFEDQVNAVVQNGLSKEQVKHFTFPIGMQEDKRKKNYFIEEEFEKDLEAFAQKCVDANLGVIVESEVRISAFNREQSFIQVSNSEPDAILSSQLLRKYALQGDRVRAFVRVLTEDEPASLAKTDGESATLDKPVDVLQQEPQVSDKRNKAFVIKILKEVNSRLVVGNFLSYRDNSKYIMFVPRDMRVPSLRIYEKDWPESFKQGTMDGITEMLYVAEITSRENEICIGKIKQSIGKCGELDSENRAILLNHNLRCEPFADKFNEQYSDEFIIPEEEIKKREDLRRECTFTIDSPTAQNLDDAISIKELPNGNFEVGVHISDVTYFLHEDSELDQLVKKRTISVYMVNEAYHMLPNPLGARCSLLPGKDRLGFSVFWTMTPNADVLTTRFTRSILRSCVQLAHQHAQMMIDDEMMNPERDVADVEFPKMHNGFTAADIARRLKQLNRLANIMKAKRLENGALTIDRPKAYFDLDPISGVPISIHKQEWLAANVVVEEFMLLANQSVAKFIYGKFPNIALLQNSPPPLGNVLKRVKDQLFKVGLLIDTRNSMSLQRSLARLVSESENPATASIALSRHFSKLLTGSRYFCSQDVNFEHFKHYGLSIPIYTHFTSPIRRYADVLVHRILAAALGYTQVPKCTPAELKALANLCNNDKYNARQASRDSTDLYFLHYIQRKGCAVMQAVVIEVYRNSCEVILVETGTLLSIKWESSPQVVVSVSNGQGVCMAKKVYPSSEVKSADLKPCSEIWVKVTAKSNQLCGEIVPPPLKSNSENCVPMKNRETIPIEKTVEAHAEKDRNNIPEFVVESAANSVPSYLPNLELPQSVEAGGMKDPHRSDFIENCNNHVLNNLSVLSENANSCSRAKTYETQRDAILKNASQDTKVSHIAFNLILILLSECLHFWRS